MHSGLAARHASWVLNSFQPVKGATPYELVYGKGEPVHVTSRVSTKEKQDSVYVCSSKKLKGKTPMCLQMQDSQKQ